MPGNMTLRGGKYSKYRHAAVNERHAGPHMVRTEAQTLDEAIDIIRARKRTRNTRIIRADSLAEKELGEQKPITLPKLKFLGDL